jgi:uncharacterized membrane protein (UPF0182 family)
MPRLYMCKLLWGYLLVNNDAACEKVNRYDTDVRRSYLGSVGRAIKKWLSSFIYPSLFQLVTMLFAATLLDAFKHVADLVYMVYCMFS